MGPGHKGRRKKGSYLGSELDRLYFSGGKKTFIRKGFPNMIGHASEMSENKGTKNQSSEEEDLIRRSTKKIKSGHDELLET